MIILGVPMPTMNEIAQFFSVVIIFAGIIWGSILCILRLFKFIDAPYSKIIKTIAKRSIIGVTFIWTLLIIRNVILWYNYSPTDVSQRELQGTYEVDRHYFRGKNANWQHAHYRLEIDDDSLRLMILNKNRIIRVFSRKIIPIEVSDRSFFVFHDDYRSDYYIKRKSAVRQYYSKKDSLVQVTRDLKIVNDSSNHHMLRVNPSLLLKPHNFRVIIYSTKYKNMYFKKID